MTAPNPFDHDDIYRFVLGGKRWIGGYALSGHDRPQAWDIKGAKGQVGALT